jgi:hypothetical protein
MSSNFGCVGFKVPTVHPSAVPKRPSPMQAWSLEERCRLDLWTWKLSEGQIIKPRENVNHENRALDIALRSAKCSYLMVFHTPNHEH